MSSVKFGDRTWSSIRKALLALGLEEDIGRDDTRFYRHPSQREHDYLVVLDKRRRDVYNGKYIDENIYFELERATDVTREKFKLALDGRRVSQVKMKGAGE